MMILLLGALLLQDADSLIDGLKRGDRESIRQLIERRYAKEVEPLLDTKHADAANEVLNTLALFRLAPSLKSTWKADPAAVEKVVRSSLDQWPRLLAGKTIAASDRSRLARFILQSARVRILMQKIHEGYVEPSDDHTWFFFEVVSLDLKGRAAELRALASEALSRLAATWRGPRLKARSTMLLGWLREKDEFVVQVAAHLLGAVSARLDETLFRRSLEGILALTASGNEEIRQAAVSALGDLAPKANLVQFEEIRDTLLRRFQDPSAAVRAAAGWGLYQTLPRKSDEKQKDIIAAFVNKASDPDPAVLDAVTLTLSDWTSVLTESDLQKIAKGFLRRPEYLSSIAKENVRLLLEKTERRFTEKQIRALVLDLIPKMKDKNAPVRAYTVEVVFWTLRRRLKGTDRNQVREAVASALKRETHEPMRHHQRRLVDYLTTK